MLEGASSFVTLGWVIICDFKFGRTENHNFTITTHMRQLVEFFHFLIFFYFFFNFKIPYLINHSSFSVIT